MSKQQRLKPADDFSYGSIDINIQQMDPRTGRMSSPTPRKYNKDLSPNNGIRVRKVDLNTIDQRPKYQELLPYYLPCMSWIPHYSWEIFFGDLVAGISLASFQIPLALSYATSIAHVEPLCGLYSLAITPLIYAIFGSVPQMIVGPESAISLVVGQATEKFSAHDSEISTVTITMMITFISGVVLFFLGSVRLGFLGNILSKALLRGFISSVGLVMIINSLIIELKLNHKLADVAGHYHTPVGKIMFLFRYASEYYHKPTAILSLICFLVLISTRIAKKKLMNRYRFLIFVPEILLVVSVTILLSLKYDFKHSYGISTIGEFNADGFGSIGNPLSNENRALYSSLWNEGLAVAMLGFFESTTASKSLGSDYNLTYSSNRELIALGFMNIVGSLFGTLPSFGGYGRSKVNVFSGGKTVMSGAMVGLITLLTAKLLLPMIHYTPTCVLSVITTVIGISLLEEVPSDIKFHIHCSGYSELTVFTLTFIATLSQSVELGVTVGCIYSLILIVKHSALSRIQILAKLEGSDEFVNVDDYIKNYNGRDFENITLEQFEHCYIVKIPEPLTFTNGEDLRSRLSRLERFGSTNVHPGSTSIVSQDDMEYIIFDLEGMTSMDSGSAQILLEIIRSYVHRDVRVYLTRVSLDREIRIRLKSAGILDLVETVQVNNAVTARYHMNDMIEKTPFFTCIEEALLIIERRAIDGDTNGNDLMHVRSGSVISNTLFNSNLV